MAIDSNTLVTTDPIIDTTIDPDDPIVTHIVGPQYHDDGSKTQGAAIVMEAIVNGTPVTALCGYTWVPTRDPQKHPLCEACIAIINHSQDVD